MKVAIEHIRYLKSEFAKINKVRLSQIEFYEKGKRIPIPKSRIKEYESVGLNNVDFIMTGFYKKGVFEDKVSVLTFTKEKK